ncbi:MAG: glycosyltransferase family 4 protein [Acidobacteria bacterium]|nr:glycosyltransferase family 4 protein [Acidobacteriota bacterium]
MRAIVDCTPLLVRSAGVKTYLHHLYVELRKQRGAAVRAYPPGVEPRDLDLESSRTPLALLAHRAPSFITQAVARGWMHGDLFHASNLVRNPPRRMRLTATIHDLTCWILPELHTPANVAADQRLAGRVWSRADRLIAVSESAKADAVRILGFDPTRIEVIHHGVEERYFEDLTVSIERVRSHYGLAKPYVLSVGTIEPRKNISRLVEAWQALSAPLRDEFDLVTAGPPGWEQPEAMNRLRAGTRYLGYVPGADLPALTAGATLFAYPSLYEGFGFPVAQAMACGVPVLTSAVSSLPEVAGDAAAFVDPKSSTEIAGALGRLLTSPSERARLAQAGRERARRDYRWDRCARQTWAFFERACG